LRLVGLPDLRTFKMLGISMLGVVSLAVAASIGVRAQAGGVLEERKLPMKFNWVTCEPGCRGWVSARKSNPSRKSAFVSSRAKAPQGRLRWLQELSVSWNRPA